MWGLPKLTLWAPGSLFPALFSLPGQIGRTEWGQMAYLQLRGLPARPPCLKVSTAWAPVLSVCLYVYVGEGRAEAEGSVPREVLLSGSWKGSPGGFLAPALTPLTGSCRTT